MRQGRTTLLLLTTLFLLTDIFFNYVLLSSGDVDFFDATTKTVFFLLGILLFSKKITWAKWILSIALILYGLVCLLLGFELMPVFYLIGLYNIFFGVYIHKSEALRSFRKEDAQSEQMRQVKIQKDEEISVLNQEQVYPTLVQRYKALMIDGLLILFTLIVTMIIVQQSEFRTPVMVSTAVLLLVIYEPFMTSYSKTVGQRMMRIKVRNHRNPEKKITLWNAYVRWFVKGILGWISFVTIHFNPQHRAIHDLASDSVMVNED
ncbi:RDD family protein [Pseudochryseolinea flava]|uniref:RDD domain-containing protein n=1 Tax=Pseudochryseolinea flava TaxID=2059302 RepID=A0A364Y357_9BACT|nr:RDD family protein [Pseudochryseolinea flava]RAW01240.1 hypothetical protein DQQ10_10025 [Pseudochryseolinea flava]